MKWTSRRPRSCSPLSCRADTVQVRREPELQGTRRANTQETTIPVLEEELQVGKHAAEGEVRVHTTVTEQPVEEQVHLREERVAVERRPVGFFGETEKFWVLVPSAWRAERT